MVKFDHVVLFVSLELVFFSISTWETSAAVVMPVDQRQLEALHFKHDFKDKSTSFSKVAVAMAGEIRTFADKRVRGHFIRAISPPINRPDIFLHLSHQFTVPGWKGDKVEIDKLRQRAPRSAVRRALEWNIKSELQPVSMVVASNSDLKQHPLWAESSPSDAENIVVRGNLKFLHLRWFALHEAIEEEERRRKVPYRFIVRTRPDYAYAGHLDYRNLGMSPLNNFGLFDYDFFAILSRSAARLALRVAVNCTELEFAPCRLRAEMIVPALLRRHGHRVGKISSFSASENNATETRPGAMLRPGKCNETLGDQSTYAIGRCSTFTEGFGCNWGPSYFASVYSIDSEVETATMCFLHPEWRIDADRSLHLRSSAKMFTFDYRKDDLNLLHKYPRLWESTKGWLFNDEQGEPSLWLSWPAPGSSDEVQPSLQSNINCTGPPYLANSRLRVWWLHIPKCGSSFSQSAMLYARSNSRKVFPTNTGEWPPGAQEHQLLPMTGTEGKLALHEAVGMFRQPEQRLLSSFAWKKSHAGCCMGDWGWNATEQFNVRQSMDRGLGPVETMGTFFGCQTNMVLGRGCFQRYPILSSSDVDVAIQRIHKFRFVGVMEEWLLSICLFNSVMTGERFVFKTQLVNNRATIGEGTRMYKVPVDLPLDRADRMLYEEIQKRFWFDVSSRNISVENCPLRCQKNGQAPRTSNTGGWIWPVGAT